MTRCLLEICAADIDSVHAAVQGGAHRVELCSALEAGGLTPSTGFIRQAVASGISAVNVLIRPRPGDFCYSEAETSIMANDIKQALSECHAQGVVIGALTPDGDIDATTVEQLLHAVPDGHEVTFHRAFDLCRNPLTALETIISLGFTRILTSGCAPTAIQGIDTLRQLHFQAAGRIQIMAGCGITPQNAAAIVLGSGVDAIHASASHTIASLMTWRNNTVHMGSTDTDEYLRKTTSQAIVNQIAQTLSRI